MLQAFCKFYARLYVWGPRGVVKKQWKILWKFCKKILRKHRCAENRVAELELWRDSQRGKVLWMTVKNWVHMLPIDGQQIVRNLETHSTAILCSATGCLLPSFWTSDTQRLGQRMVLKHFTTNIQSGSTKSKNRFCQLHHFGNPKTHTVRITIDKGPTYILLA